MHRDQRFRTQLDESLDRFLRVHVHLAARWWIVGADGQQRDVDLVTLADFFEAGKIGAVATMKHGPAIHADYESAEAAMTIGEKTRAPMMRRRQRHFQFVELDGLPFIELVHDVEAEPVDEIADAVGNNDRLVGGHSPQGAPVEMIEVRVRDKHVIDRGQMMDLESRTLQSFDDLEPFRPVWIDQNVGVARLEQKRRVPDPGKADLAVLNFRKLRRGVSAGAFDEERRNEDLSEVIAFVPIAPGPQPHAGGAFCCRRFLRFLANNVAATLFRKTDRHLGATIVLDDAK